MNGGYWGAGYWGNRFWGLGYWNEAGGAPPSPETHRPKIFTGWYRTWPLGG